jgi:hypothetical protein
MSRHHPGAVDALFVVRIYPTIAARPVGIKCGSALFSDGQRARFRALSRDPAAVRLVDGPCPTREYERAVEAWLERNARTAV